MVAGLQLSKELSMMKKEYKAPKLSIVDMKFQAALMACSNCDGPDAEEYDDEFGFNFNPENNRKA